MITVNDGRAQSHLSSYLSLCPGKQRELKVGKNEGEEARKKK